MNASQMSSDARAAANARLESLRRFLAVEPGNARLRRDVVNTAVAAGQFDYVRELAESRLADAPDDAEAQFDRATALIGLVDYDAALEALQPLDATIPGVRFNTGLCLAMLGRHAEARAYLEAGYAAGERTPSLLKFLLLTLHHIGDLQAACTLVESNEAAFASSPDLSGHVALMYHDAGLPDRAYPWAVRTLAQDPDNIDALIVDGTRRAEQFDAQGAHASFERVLKRAPENGRAWIGIATMTMASQDFAKATEQFERGLRALPRDLGAWQALGWNHLLAGNLEQAEKVFNHALGINRNFCESHGGLASVAALRGDRIAAERLIRVATGLDKDCYSARFARAVLAGMTGGEDSFRNELLRAMHALPASARNLAKKLSSSD
jgi:tetratricopeptide (TPR) repeat protein